MVHQHHGVIPTPARRVGGDDSFQIEELPEGVQGIDDRSGHVLPETAIVVGKLVPVQVTSFVEEWPHLLDGCDGRERYLVAGGRVEEVELGAGVGGDEPAVGRPDDVAILDGWVGQPHRVRLPIGEAVELSGAASVGGCGVEETGRLGAGVVTGATYGAAAGTPGAADGGEAEDVWELELSQYDPEDVGRQLRPVWRRQLHLHGWIMDMPATVLK